MGMSHYIDILNYSLSILLDMRYRKIDISKIKIGLYLFIIYIIQIK